MKKMIILVAFLALSVLTSCSSDDNQPLSVDASIVGTWNLTAEWKDDLAQDLNNCRLQETYVFNQDGTFSLVFDDDAGTGDPNNCDMGSTLGTYTLNSNVLSITFTDGEQVTLDFNVSLLNETTLKFSDQFDNYLLIQEWTRQ